MTGTPQRAASPATVRRGPGRPSIQQPTPEGRAFAGLPVPAQLPADAELPVPVELPVQAELPVHAVVVTGAPASGKTTFAVALARRCRLARFDLDEITGPLTRAALALVGAEEDALDRDLGEQLRQARYGSLLRAAAGQAVGIVVVAPFTRERSDPSSWEGVVSLLAGPPGAGAGVVLVHIDTPPDLLATRMRRRNAARDQGKLAGAVAAGSLARPVVAHVTVDGTLPVEAQVDAAVAAITATSSTATSSTAGSSTADGSRPC